MMPLSYNLPRRRPVARSGILRGPQRIWTRHRKFVRSHGCCVPACQNTDIEFAHVRSAANAGTGMKPHDAFGISLCARHHKTQHEIGQPAFERKYGIDLGALAAAFVKASPDSAMRESLKLVPQTVIGDKPQSQNTDSSNTTTVVAEAESGGEGGNDI